MDRPGPFRPIEIALPGHFVPGVGLRQHTEVGESRPKARGPRVCADLQIMPTLAGK